MLLVCTVSSFSLSIPISSSHFFLLSLFSGRIGCNCIYAHIKCDVWFRFAATLYGWRCLNKSAFRSRCDGKAQSKHFVSHKMEKRLQNQQRI